MQKAWLQIVVGVVVEQSADAGAAAGTVRAVEVGSAASMVN